jgi:hypothetical protein
MAPRHGPAFAGTFLRTSLRFRCERGYLLREGSLAGGARKVSVAAFVRTREWCASERADSRTSGRRMRETRAPDAELPRSYERSYVRRGA